MRDVYEDLVKAAYARSDDYDPTRITEPLEKAGDGYVHPHYPKMAARAKEASAYARRQGAKDLSTSIAAHEDAFDAHERAYRIAPEGKGGKHQREMTYHDHQIKVAGRNRTVKSEENEIMEKSAADEMTEVFGEVLNKSENPKAERLAKALDAFDDEDIDAAVELVKGKRKSGSKGTGTGKSNPVRQANAQEDQGGHGPNKKTPVRSVKAKQHDQTASTPPNSYKSENGDAVDDDNEDDGDDGSDMAVKGGDCCKKCGKSVCECHDKKLNKGFTVLRKSELVEYVDTGSDAAIADMLQKGLVGAGGIPSAMPFNLVRQQREEVEDTEE